MMKQKRLDHLDIARGVAIILVVWGHVDRRMEPNFFKTNLALVSEVIYGFHVALLFIISGALQRSMLGKLDLLSILARLSRSILVPFMTLSFVFMVLTLLTPQSILKSPTFIEMLQGVFLFQSSPEHAPSGVLWFLFVLFSGMTITALLNKWLGFSLAQILVVAVVIKIGSGLVDDVYLFALGKFARNYVFLVLGTFFANLVKDGQAEAHSPLIAWGAAAVFIPFFLGMDIYKPFFQLVTGVLGSIVVLRFSAMATKIKSPLIGWLKYCGVNSILIFVFHMPFITVFIKPLLVKTNLLDSFFGFGLSLILACLLPLAVGVVLRHLSFLNAILLGKYPARVHISIK